MEIWPAHSHWVARGTAHRIAPIKAGQIRRIAVIKHGALGDMLLTRPMFHALRHHFPNASLTLSAVSHDMQGIPEDLVDRVHVVPGKGSGANTGEYYRAFKALGYHDLLFDITASTRSFWIARLNKALLKVGFKHRHWHRLVYDLAIERAHLRFEAETFMEQLQVLGFGHEWPPRFDLPVTPVQRARPYVVYFPTASVGYKCWPAQRYGALMERMSAEYPGYEHLLLVGLADWERAVGRQIAEQVAQLANVAVVPGGPETFNLVAGARLLVSNDTGIRNLAIATNTPTVGVFLLSPFGYEPRFGDHRIVFHPDGKVPEVGEVAALMRRQLGDNRTAGEKAA